MKKTFTKQIKIDNLITDNDVGRPIDSPNSLTCESGEPVSVPGSVAAVPGVVADE